MCQWGRSFLTIFYVVKIPRPHWHRVVNHQGRISPGWIEQIDLLKSEGVTFKDDFCVDLKKHQWNI